MREFHGNQHTANEYDDYTYDDLLGDVRDLARALGHSPTTRDARDHDALPCLARIYDLTDDWNTVLADAGLEPTQVETYGDHERPAMLADLRAVHESVEGCLTTREYRDRGEYATSTIKKAFGSWREACEAAGVEPGEKYGEPCVGPNGERLESRHELAVAQVLADHGIAYEVHPPVPETNLECDFHLLDLDLWVEVDGFYPGQRPNEHTFERKLDLYEERGMEFVVVDGPDELRDRLFSVE